MLVDELRNVIAKLEHLKNDEQIAVAKLLEEEINWENTLRNSQEQLSNLAAEALKEYGSGKTKKKDW
jgi:hypothetical protein